MELPPEQLRNHFVAITAAIKHLTGGADEAGMGAGGPPAPAPAAPGPEASAPPPPMGKGEMKSNPANGGEMLAVKKYEEEIAALKGEIAGLKKSDEEKTALFDRLAKGVERIATKPERKAVTNVAAVGKPGSEPAPAHQSLSKSEVMAKLTVKARDPKLTKDQKKAILAYCNGTVDIEAVKDLL